MASISEHVTDDQITLLLSGRVEFPFRKTFHAAINQAQHANPKKVVLNFTDVSFINSAGLGLLMLAFNQLKEANIQLVLEVPPGYVRDVFELASLGNKIPISPIPAKPASAPPPKPPVRPAPPPTPLVFELDEMQERLLPIIDAIEQQTYDLPPIPKVASQVLALIADPTATQDRLTTLIQQDPVLTAKIFKVANSAGCGASRPIESLSQAIVWLGLNSVANLTMALSLHSGVFNDRGYEREVQNIWAHAIATAFYAKTLAQMIGENPDTAFLCGLLHTIGKLAVVHQVNQPQETSEPPLRWSVIDTLMRQSYIGVGRRLAEAWQFPPSVQEAIQLHHDYSYHLAVHPSKGAVLTCLAHILAIHHVDSVAMSEDMLRNLPVTAVLNISKDVMDALLETKRVVQAQIDAMLAS